MKVKEIKGFTLMEAEEGMKLRLRGSKDEPVSKMPVAVGRTLADYEEIALEDYEREKAEAARMAAYKARVVELIRQRYDADDEAALIHNFFAAQTATADEDAQAHAEAETHAGEYLGYLTFRQECKARAKSELNI